MADEKRTLLELCGSVEHVTYHNDKNQYTVLDLATEAGVATVVGMFPFVSEGEELLRDMAASTIKMVTESVDAYVKHDTMLAEKVIAEDDIVDGWFDRVKHTLIRRMTADPGEGERAVDLLMIAKYFERIGDHAVNVAQWVIFSVTGTHKEG